MSCIGSGERVWRYIFFRKNIFIDPYCLKSFGPLQQLYIRSVVISNKIPMFTLLDNLSLVHHKDELCIADGAQPVGHDHLCATPAGEVLNYSLFGFGVKS